MEAETKLRNSLILTCLLSLALLPAVCSGGIEGRIKTMVILVMENRSFDHMLGWMKRKNPQIDGVTGKEWNALSTTDSNSDRIFFSDDAEYVDPNPGHSFEAIAEQVFGSDTNFSRPTMTGFAQQAGKIDSNMSELVMKGFRPDVVPVYSALTDEFAIFDRWFSSLPGPTQPNRLFVYSATSQGATLHVPKQLAKGYPQKTIFQSIHESGLSFGIYYHSIPTTLFYRELRKLKYVSKFHSFQKKFQRHAAGGSLPNLVVIEPRYFDLKDSPANDDHPSHDVSNGQRLVKEVYEALRSSPQWNETLLVITYDEHGGFYDHVPTPVKDVPTPDGIVGPPPYFFRFDRLGVRVPTIMVSPWIDKRTVVHRPTGPFPSSEYEHSSIPATIKKVFNLSSNFLTYRDAWAGTFEGVVSQRSTPRTDCIDISKMMKNGEVDEEAELSEFQREVVQLAAVLSGDSALKSYPEEIGNKMNVKEAHYYTENAMSRFAEASREALALGASDSIIVEMRSSLTTRIHKNINNNL
ncbi:non-specific phospholipase C6 isoform X2 [Cryptomeria japonica]|uniref:non-specific phospholipase C6 isoform X2 n=1 Tax=Cryptomeria japonica TaxID=3369 RepID=UPI0027D9DAC3|nr:non-specific phospholipase C6 isoform X2 [Cryptomeria japonica]